jgi:ABC-type transport system involved in Fe-S cluster assembly fused permease/ATPase subunit
MLKNAEKMAAIGDVFRLFRSISSSYVRRRLVLVVVMAVVISALGAFPPIALKWLVDSFGAARGAVPAAVVLALTLYVVSQWLGRVLGSVQSYVLAQADRRMYRALNDRLFDHVIRLPLRFHLNRQTGAVSEALTNGLQGYQIVVQVALISALPVAVQLFTIAFVLVHLDQQVLMLMCVITLSCYGVAFAHGGIGSVRAARQVSAAQIEARALMTDSILNYETIKYFTAEPIIRERIDRALLRSEHDWLKFYGVRVRNGLLTGTIFAAFLATTLFYAVHRVSSGAMTVGTFVLVNAYMLQLVAPIEMIGAAVQQLSQGLAFLEKMLDLFRERPEPAVQDGASQPLRGPGKLEFDRVSVGYRRDRVALENISFVLPPGKTLGIVGASGAGKSTLVRLLVRLIDPGSGRILIDDVPIADSPVADLRGAIAVVPQDTVLFNESIGYNIAFGRVGCMQEEIEAAARTAELHSLIMSLPEGYDTRVGERGVKLSGGEKQRVSIARAALKRPRMYVFDEATSSLDSKTEQEILRNLRTLSAQSTTLIIAHRLSTVIHADEIIVMQDGVIVERGSHEVLLRQNGKYAELWIAQQQGSVAA